MLRFLMFSRGVWAVGGQGIWMRTFNIMLLCRCFSRFIKQKNISTKQWYLSRFKTKKAHYLYCWRNQQSQSVPHPMCHVPDRHRTDKTRSSQTLLMLRSTGRHAYDLPGGNLMRSARCLELMRNSLTLACIWAESHFYSTTKSNEPWNQSKTPLLGPVTVCVWCEYQCGSFCSGPFATVQMDPQIKTVKAYYTQLINLIKCLIN